MMRGVWWVYLAVAVLLAVAPAKADEQKEREAIIADVRRMMDAQDYPGLEALATQYLRTEERTESGVWKLGQFYAGISEQFASRTRDQNTWDTRAARCYLWNQRYPRSSTAQLACAQLVVNFAWSLRGTSGYASEVEQDSWPKFKAQSRFAAQYLLKMDKRARKDPHWYVLALTVARYEGVDVQSFMNLYDEGIRRHPRFYGIHFSAVENFVPKWGGSADAIDALVKRAQKRLPRKERDALYARMYWLAAQSQFRDSLFAWSKADWPTMRSGFQDILEDYPSEWNLQSFAYFACEAGDMDTARTLMSKMTQAPDREAWLGKDSYARCQSKAAGEMPAGSRTLS
jgi:hypothetical protein